MISEKASALVLALREMANEVEASEAAQQQPTGSTAALNEPTTVKGLPNGGFEASSGEGGDRIVGYGATPTLAVQDYRLSPRHREAEPYVHLLGAARGAKEKQTEGVPAPAGKVDTPPLGPQLQDCQGTHDWPYTDSANIWLLLQRSVLTISEFVALSSSPETALQMPAALSPESMQRWAAALIAARDLSNDLNAWRPL